MGNLESECETALQQIDDRMYAKEYEDDYDQILCYGISFFKKRCMVKKKWVIGRLSFESCIIRTKTAGCPKQKLLDSPRLFYNDPIGYADFVLNGNPETYLKTVTECKPLD